MKRNATNTALLAVIKAQYNGKIYKHALALYNAESSKATSEVAVIAYLQQFGANDIRPGLEAAAHDHLQRLADDRGRRFNAYAGR